MILASPKLQALLLVLAVPSALAGFLPPPGHAQQRRKASVETEIIAKYTEAADKLAEENRWPEAIDAYITAIRLHPKYGPAYKGLGDAYFNAGKWEQALAAYTEATRVAPRDAQAWFDLGDCYNAMGRHGEAFVPLVKAKDLDPSFTEAYYGIGYAYLRGKEIDKSVSWLRSALSTDPEYALAYYGLALAYTRLGSLSLADEARRKLLTLDPALAQKLDREIRTPQSAVAPPLPPITIMESPKTVTDNKAKGAAAEQARTSQTPPQTPPAEVLAQPALPNMRNPSAAREVSPNQQLPVTTSETPSTAAGEQSTARMNAAERPDGDRTSRRPSLLQIETELSKQGVAAAEAQPQTRVAEPSQPAPAQPATPAAAWPVTTWPTKAKRWALVIGVDNYSEDSHNTWRGASNDAQTLRDALVRYAGFPSDQVILLSSDQPLNQQPSRSAIVQALRSLHGRIPKDGLLLVSFAGHGIERNGRSYLLPSDAPAIDDLSLLEYTAINVEYLKDRIRDLGVGQVLFVLDTSKNDPTPGRSGNDNPMTATFSKSFSFDSNRREVTSFATLYATAVGQRAYNYAAQKQGYFTWALTDGLSGKAANLKGEVTLAGLVKFVQETVPRYVQRDLGSEKLQVPFAVIQGYKEDELVIATSKTAAP